MPVPPPRVSTFQKMIFSWWKRHKRDLPWRHTRDPYKILVSEVMLQQTQVARVLPKYREFLTAFPNVNSLAKSATAHVLRVWKGMGYNRRALYLKRTAEKVVDTYHGKFPDSEVELTKLPGLGMYTARALMVFAFEKDVAMVDTNIRQIITHFFFNGAPQKEKLIQTVADEILPKGKSWEWHQALMDYGSLELPRVATIAPVQKKQTQPFKESDRFIRGKIIDVLRDGDKTEEALISLTIHTHHKTRQEIKRIIRGLIRDGLAARSGRTIHLPK